MSTLDHVREATHDSTPAAMEHVHVTPKCPEIELPPGFTLEWTASLRTAPRIRPPTGESPSLGATPTEIWTAFLEHDPGPGRHVSGFSPNLGRFVVRDGDVCHAGGDRLPINSEMRSHIGREIAGGAFLIYDAPNDATASARAARVLHDVSDRGLSATSASIDCSGLPPAATRMAGGELTRSTTAAGLDGADCQPAWGTSLDIHLVGVTDRDGSRGRFITPAEGPEFCAARRHGGVGLWVAEVTSIWRQDEDGSSEHLQRLRVVPLHQFFDESRPGSTSIALGEAHQNMRAFARRSMDDDQISDQSYVDTENRLFSPARAAQIREEAMHRLATLAAGTEMPISDLVAQSRSDPLAVGGRVSIASPINDISEQDRQLAIIHARAKVRRLGQELAGDNLGQHPVLRARIASILADLDVPAPQPGG